MEKLSARNKYLGVKLIEAELRMGYRDFTSPEELGYAVVYEDGYHSWSPKDTFEKAYRPITDMTFGLAVEALKKGFKVARRGWNGKNMYVFLHPVMDFDFSELLPHFIMKNAQNAHNCWSISNSDALAEDWFVYEL